MYKIFTWDDCFLTFVGKPHKDNVIKVFVDSGFYKWGFTTTRQKAVRLMSKLKEYDYKII